MKNYFKNLNDEQKIAVKHFKGPCMVLAGPGTGKTTIIVNRTMNLIKKYGINPSNILVVTFTKAAAKEMEERFSNINSYVRKYREVTFGTFHSVCFRILKYYKNYRLENLIKEKEKYVIIKSIIKTLGYSFYEDEQILESIVKELCYIQNMLICDDAYNPVSCDYDKFWDINEKYKKYKLEKKSFDYEDMITHCYELLINNSSVLNDLRGKYSYIQIDEFQDINIAQFEIMKLIAYPSNNLYVVGDDDQSIYKFRGADPTLMRDFENSFNDVKIITLESNYRNNKSILKSAMSVINCNTNRYNKEIKTVKGIGKLPRIVRVEDFEQEAKVIGEKIKGLSNERNGFSSIAVIYRTNIQSRAIIEAFIDKNIPFICRDGLLTIYNHWIFDDIICYLKASQNIEKSNSIYRIINKPYRYINRDKVLNIINIDGDLLYNLLNIDDLNSYQLKKIKKLNSHIEKIKNMQTYKAIDYIINNIGYGEYIKDYAFSRHMDVKPLLNVMYEAKSSAKNFDCIVEYLDHVTDVANSLKYKKNMLSDKNSVEIMTMHKAKGLEFDIVFIAGAVETLIPCILEEKITVEVLEEERRLFYVAMTRAKDELYLFVPKYRFGNKVEQSRFINEMDLWLRIPTGKARHIT